MPDAVEHAQLAVVIDPVSAWNNMILGQALYMNEQYAEALEQIAHTLELAPEFPFAVFFAGLINFAMGNHDEGIAYLERAKSAREDFGAALGLLFALAGQREKAQAIRADIANAGDHIPPFAGAVVDLGLGNWDAAMEGLERSVEQRDWHMLLLHADPLVKKSANRPEFQALLHRIGVT